MACYVCHAKQETTFILRKARLHALRRSTPVFLLKAIARYPPPCTKSRKTDDRILATQKQYLRVADSLKVLSALPFSGSSTVLYRTR